MHHSSTELQWIRPPQQARTQQGLERLPLGADPARERCQEHHDGGLAGGRHIGLDLGVQLRLEPRRANHAGEQAAIGGRSLEELGHGRTLAAGAAGRAC